MKLFFVNKKMTIIMVIHCFSFFHFAAFFSIDRSINWLTSYIYSLPFFLFFSFFYEPNDSLTAAIILVFKKTNKKIYSKQIGFFKRAGRLFLIVRILRSKGVADYYKTKSIAWQPYFICLLILVYMWTD